MPIENYTDTETDILDNEFRELVDRLTYTAGAEGFRNTKETRDAVRRMNELLSQ